MNLQINPEKMEEEFVKASIHVEDGTSQNKSNANRIATTKYSLLSWIPVSFLQQFRRVANAYFLLISILMLIGTYAPEVFLSPLEPTSTVGTLVIVMLITSIKEGYEDYQRYKSDKFENSRNVTVVTFGNGGEVHEIVKKSKHVNPGDIVKLEGLMPAPVDMLLVLTSLHHDGNKCYIETANIDGETNLKVREAPSQLYDHFPDQLKAGKPDPTMFRGALEFEAPNKNIHNFVGTLQLDSISEPISLSAQNIVLRSALFSNTDWGYGIAIYTGQETKIQMNNRHAPSKMSRVEEKLNIAVIIIFIALCVLTTVSVISVYATGFDDESKLPYVFPPNQDNNTLLPLWLEQWFVFFLLYNNFIPISLYVTIELVNVGQAFLIGSDEKLYRAELDTPCTVRASNLAQELGMVSNVFSDKTGTLTRNEMKLVKYVINGEIRDINDEQKNDGGMQKSSKFYDFFRCLTTCHTVVREKSGKYRAESPDELALVEGAGVYGCQLVERGSKEMLVEIFEEKKTFEILAVNPFNSDRKRMSVLLKDLKANEYLILCKGADNIMLPLCSISQQEKAKIDESLIDLSNMGLRTLVIAQKKITEEAAKDWLKRYKVALSSTNNRDEKISSVSAELELQMDLLGVTAIEDRLQDEVPEVIADLTKAGIIVWMLTGDKEETAINIGRSCNLLLNDTHLVMLSRIESPEDFARQLNEEYEKMLEDKNPNTAMVLDGPSFTHFSYKDPEQRAKLLRIGAGCRSVISCRLTPVQKQELVKLVKKDTVPKATCLSIGDGANDVSMILEANVGVGIFGKEGRQAANNADFAIGEFKFLRRLLLVHGRWNYIRQSNAFLYSMHKNMVLTLTLFWFSYYTAVSGTSLYQSWVYSSFNIILFLPILFYGILDRDISDEFVLAHPQVYATGRTNSKLDVTAISIWISNAIMYTIVLCLLYYIALAPSFYSLGIYEAGTTVFTGLVMSMQAKAAFFHNQWAYPQVSVMVISIVGMFIYYVIIGNSLLEAYYDFYGVDQAIYAQAQFWLFSIFMVPITVVLIDWVGYYTTLLINPTPEMLYRELENKEVFTPVEMLQSCASGDDGVPERAGSDASGDAAQRKQNSMEMQKILQV